MEERHYIEDCIGKEERKKRKKERKEPRTKGKVIYTRKTRILNISEKREIETKIM